MPKHVQTHLSGIFRPRLLPTGGDGLGGGGSTEDSDAAAFIAAAVITDETQRDAIRELVRALKAASLWSKLTAAYPMVGGSASSHAVNLKSPGTYNITFSGGITHSSTGALWNGTTGYGDTGLVPSSVLTANSTHVSYYSRTSDTVNGKGEIGVFSGVNFHSVALACYTTAGGGGSTGIAYAYDGSTDGDRATLTATESTNSAGFFVGSRTSASVHTMFKGVTAGSVRTTLTGNFPSIVDSVFIGAHNSRGTAVRFSNRQCAFATIGAGLSNTDVTNLYNAVQTFQTTLGRQV